MSIPEAHEDYEKYVTALGGPAQKQIANPSSLAAGLAMNSCHAKCISLAKSSSCLWSAGEVLMALDLAL